MALATASALRRASANRAIGDPPVDIDRFEEHDDGDDMAKGLSQPHRRSATDDIGGETCVQIKTV